MEAVETVVDAVDAAVVIELGLHAVASLYGVIEEVVELLFVGFAW